MAKDRADASAQPPICRMTSASEASTLRVRRQLGAFFIERAHEQIEELPGGSVRKLSNYETRRKAFEVGMPRWMQYGREERRIRTTLDGQDDYDGVEPVLQPAPWLQLCPCGAAAKA